MSTPEQARADDRRQGRVLQALRISTPFQRLLDQLSINLQIVLHLFNTTGRQGDLLGKLTFDLVFNLAL
ncbi:hypothetical protein D3C72_1393260 [compost metagenome]